MRFRGVGGRSPRRRLLGLALGIALGWLLWSALPIAAQDGAPSASPPLRVATRLMRPDAFEDNGQIVGFSVDIGRAMAEQVRLDPTQQQPPIQIQTYADVAGILAALRSGEADLGLAAIPITSQREQDFDFSHPLLSAGLQIMVPEPADQRRRAEQEIFQRIFQPDLLRLSGLVALLMLIPAHVLWYFERRSENGVIQHASYFPGIFEALWCLVLVLVGQAEDMPNGPVGRLVAVFWAFVGVIYLTYFTAGLTAELTLQELRGDIQGLEDLQNRPVALVGDPLAADFLEAQNVRQVTRFEQPEPAYRALLQGEVEAMIAPRPLLLHFAAYEPDERFEVVGAPFLEQFYAIAMAKGSPYRTPVNRALLRLRENGTYTDIYRRWFGVDP